MSLREAARAGFLFVWDDARLAWPSPDLFDPVWWRAHGALTGESAGRGVAYFVAGLDGTPWVLRHNRRGGVLARINHDRYLWTGRARARPPAELRLLAAMRGRGLPVPAPVAAQVRRIGGCYRGDVITRRIPGSVALADYLGARRLGRERWRALGATLARFHQARVWHADLNARNLVLDARGGFYLIDFDCARLRSGNRWRVANLARLRRSLDKFARADPAFCFAGDDWRALQRGYRRRFAGGL